MSSNPLSQLINPRFPAAAAAIESKRATVVHLDRRRGNGYTVRRAASISLPDALVQPNFDERNIADEDELAGLLEELVTSAGMGRQQKWSIALPETATRTIILTLESAPAARSEVEEILRWKTERGFGAPLEDLRIARARLPTDAQGRARYVVAAARLDVLAGYENVFAALGWRAGLILPRHIGEARWLIKDRAPNDALLISSHAEGFTALLVRQAQPLITRFVSCEPEDREDELYRLLLFYRDRAAVSSDDAPPSLIERLLVVGEGFNKNRVSEIVNDTLGIALQPLDAETVGLKLPSGEIGFDALAAPAGLATLAWS